MKIIINSLIRIAIMMILASAGLVFIFSEEQDQNQWRFIVHAIFDKALGVGCLYVMARLYDRWRGSDRWLARFDAWNAKGLEEDDLHKQFEARQDYEQSI